jgi:hypothetical protein
MMNFYEYHNDRLDQFDLYYTSLHRCLNFGIDEGYDWSSVQHIFKRVDDCAYYYAVRILKRRWPRGEPAILTNLWFSHLYAIEVIKGRWPEAEPNLMKDPYRAYAYAKFVMKERWLEAEPTISTQISVWKHYKRHFNIQECNSIE